MVIAVYALLNFAGALGSSTRPSSCAGDGRTPGKRVAGTQVVKVDGSPAGFSESAIRNLVRIVDFLPMAHAIGVVTMFFNRQAWRLGDFAVGTLVVKQRSEIRPGCARRHGAQAQAADATARHSGQHSRHGTRGGGAGRNRLQFPTLRRGP